MPDDSSYAGKILWVDSYHSEYEWSIEIEEGLRSVINPTGVELRIVRMDTKRNPGPQASHTAAREALAVISAFEPDVVIATDDNAQTYLVVPHLRDVGVSVVFAGVNWDASEYGYSSSPNVTGMIEVDLVEPLVDLLAVHADGIRVGYISGDTKTDRKLVDVYNDRFFGGEVVASFVTTFDEFQQAFVEMQEQVDILLFGNNAGIEGWDDAAAAELAATHTSIPTGSRSSWMAPYVLVTLAKLGQEQGEWAATTALEILQGASPASIPEAENAVGKLIVNADIADALGVVFGPSVLRTAEIYREVEPSG